MFDIRYLLIIILLGISIYLIYNIYTTQSRHFDILKENITSSLEIEFDDINEKLDNLEEMLDKRLGDCNKKIKDLYSLQNKVIEVNKMNNQSIINQFNQFDENMEGLDENDEIKNQIFNSVENSVGNNKNNNCFVKINQVKNQDKEMFYMSSDHKNNQFSGTSNINSINEYQNLIHKKLKSKSSSSNSSTASSNTSINTSKSSSNKSNKSNTSKSDISLKKKSKGKGVNIFVNTKDKESDNSMVLEVEDGYIKSNCITSSSPLASSAYKILNDTMLKNGSLSKFNSLDSEDLNGFILGKSNYDQGYQDDQDDQFKENLEESGDFVINGIDMIEIMRKSLDTSDESKSSSNSENSSSMTGDDPKIVDPNFINLSNFDFSGFPGLNRSEKKSKVIDIE